jgi:hypothetical protein
MAETTAVSPPRMLGDIPPFCPIQSRPNGKPLQDKRAKITSLILRIWCKRQRTRKWRILKKTVLLRSLLGATGRSQNRPR